MLPTDDADARGASSTRQGGRLHKLIEAGDTHELARRVMLLQKVALDLQQQLSKATSEKQLGEYLQLSLVGCFGCDQLVLLKGSAARGTFEIMGEEGDLEVELLEQLPMLTAKLAPFLPHLPPLSSLVPAATESLENTVQALDRLGFAQAAWLNIDKRVDMILLVGPKLSGEIYDEFDQTLLRGAMDAVNIAYSRLLLIADVERRNAELTLAHERLLRIDDLKSAILTGVSHELRTPLTRVLSYAEALRDNGRELSERQTRDFIRVIVGSTQKLSQIVDDSLTFAELIGERTTPVRDLIHLHTVVEEALLLHRPEAVLRSIRMESFCEPHAVYSDPEYVRMILRNLVVNALRFTRRGGRVSLELVAHEQGAAIVVRDTADAIPFETRGRIWRLFETGDMSLRREEDGLGLGLALAQRLASELEVTLELASSDETGNAFRIHIPDATRVPRRLRSASGEEARHEQEPSTVVVRDRLKR